MNPISTWTYYRRHKRHTLLLLSLSMLITIGLYGLIALVWGAFVEPGRRAYQAYAEFSLVSPRSSPTGADPGILPRLESNRDIERILPTTYIRIQLPGIVPGQGFQFDLLALEEADMPYFVHKFGADLIQGRLPGSGSAELVLSKDLADMLDLEVGQFYLVESFEFYLGMDAVPDPTPFEVVGVLDSGTELGILSLAFLQDHEPYHQLPSRYLVAAREGRKEAVDEFLRTEISSPKAEVMTHEMLSERILNEALPGLLMLLPVVVIVAMGFSLVIIVIHKIANAARNPEFAILHAIGRSKTWLSRRLTRETGWIAWAGWALGTLAGAGIIALFRTSFFQARGLDLSYPAWLPVVFSIPTPAVITLFSYLEFKRMFSQLDPVAIVERRELSGEAPVRSKTERGGSHHKPMKSIKPISARTYYQRHPRRAVMLISSMGTMILALTLFLFAISVGADAKEPFLRYLQQISILQSAGITQDLDPAIVEKVAAHPAVERLVPVSPRFHILNAYIPPFNNMEASPWGVYAEDMAYLVERYGLELAQGQLPRSGSNEIVIPECLAKNRSLVVGDIIGDPQNPAYPNAPALVTPVVISGIFAGPPGGEDVCGLGFASLEFLENQPSYPVPDHPSMIIIPRSGQKAVLDAWLEQELAGQGVSILTYQKQVERVQQQARQDLLSMGILESLIAVVAALGLAVLNYIFIAQRRAEFGLLNALGYSRRRLARRVFSETMLVATAAWAASAILAVIILLVLRLFLYQPTGLTLNLLNPLPWLYTLPIPIIVLAVNTISTTRTLLRLDPISIIERVS